MIEEMDAAGAEALVARFEGEGRSVERLGWARQQLLQRVLAESSWERWSGLVDGPDVDKLLSGGEFRLRSERVNGPKIAFCAADPARRAEAVELLKIDPGMLERKIASLSNGEMRRAMLARIWMERPDLLVLDDFKGGLDPFWRETLPKIVEKLDRQGVRVVKIVYPKGEAGPEGEFEDAPAEAVAYAPERFPDSLKPMVPAGTEVAAFRGVRVSYGDHVVFDGLDWRIAAGDRWLLAGPNGAGKSTLLALLRADHPQLFKNDVVLFGERPGQGLDVWTHRQRVLLLSPELQMHLAPRSRVRDVVLGGVQNVWDRVAPPTWAEETRTREALDALGIADWAETRWSALEPSKQRRALMARAYASVPEILLLDETFHGLAPEDERAMRAALERMLPQVPVLVWVTHNEASAPRWLNRSLRLRGRS
ncbi:MAG: ATP-binding cassette domain-containing protein [Fibrobacterales bacterium]|nr:ATP-binding cassette domain-containing protein [Fibrobacterales bacterium]